MQFPAMAGWVCLALSLTGAAQGYSSLSETDIEFTETKLTLQSAVEQNKSLSQQLTLAKEQVRVLTESLAISNGEAEVFKRQANELRLRMEALGIESAGADKSQLEQRLLKATNDLRLVQEERDKLADQLVKLSEAALNFTRTAESPDVQGRLLLELELRAASEIVGLPMAQDSLSKNDAVSMMSAAVISYDKSLGLVVANVGAKAGVKLGMPFEVWRGQKFLAVVRVVDVRDKIAGAVIQDLENDKNPINVGDRLRVQTNK